MKDHVYDNDKMKRRDVGILFNYCCHGLRAYSRSSIKRGAASGWLKGPSRE